jgi:hypothetical protein
MTLPILTLGLLTAATLLGFHVALRDVAWGGSKIVLWAALVAVLGAYLVVTARTARSLANGSTRRQARDVWAIAILGLALVQLALQLPWVIRMAGR